MADIPECRTCGHTPCWHDKGPDRKCTVPKTDKLTDKRSDCSCELFVPPEDWVYSPADTCKKQRNGLKHVARIVDVENRSGIYTVMARCQYCNKELVLSQRITPPSDGAKYARQEDEPK